MFTDKYPNDDISFTEDISLHDGVPKQFYSIKNKQFTDWEIPPWELTIYKNRLLGEGSFSKVYLGKWRKTFVVAKVVDPQIIKHKKNLVLREIDNLTKLHHPNIVQVLGYIDDPFIIILEYIPKGDLLQNTPKLWKSQKKKIMVNILQALAYFHNRKPLTLIHRDIKPTNILLTNSLVAKITDFGLSKFTETEIIRDLSVENLTVLDEYGTSIIRNSPELTRSVGTERYLAPEMPCSNYTNKIDIYATGILLHEMFENKRYIPNTNLVWFWTPKKIKYIIINNMLNLNPNDRSSALEILDLLKKQKIIVN